MSFNNSPELFSAWQRKFALFPRRIGVRNGRSVWRWLVFYETREIDDFSFERRPIGNSAVKPIEFWVNRAY